MRIAVVGIVRDCEKTLAASVSALTLAIEPHVVELWHIIESDSHDATVSVLAELASRIQGFSFKSLGFMAEKVPDRIERLAKCRDHYLQWVESRIEDLDWVIVVDFDGLATKLSNQELAVALESYNDLDVMAANSYGRYYDIFALRATGWVEEDYRLTELNLVNQGLNPFRAKYVALISRQRVLSPRSSPLLVDSAFGGLAMYKAETLRGVHYAQPVNFECEHVSLHRQVRSNGYRLGILPSLRVSPERRHTMLSCWPLRPVWVILGMLPQRIASFLWRFIDFGKTK